MYICDIDYTVMLQNGKSILVLFISGTVVVILLTVVLTHGVGVRNMAFLVQQGTGTADSTSTADKYPDKPGLLESGTSQLPDFYKRDESVHPSSSFSSLTVKEEPRFLRESFNASKVSSLPIGADNTTDKDRYLIYRCDEGNMNFCGGWTDRIRGAMTAYMIANLTGRTFKMEMLFDTCDLHKFIVSNRVDWYLPVSFHKTVQVGGDVAKLVKIDDKAFIRNVDEDFLAMPEMKAKFVYFKSNLDSTVKFQSLLHYQKQLAWMGGLNNAEMNDAIYRRLFKPSAYLQSKVAALLKKRVGPRDKLVCAHVRMGTNPSLPDDERIFFKTEHLPNVWDWIREESTRDSTKIFFMSDSEKAIAEASKQSFKDKLFLNPGKVVHIERKRTVSAEEHCRGLEKVILEQLILMQCDVLMISASGVSRMAAYVRGTDRGLFCYMLSGIVVPCTRSDIAEMYNLNL